MEEVRPGSNLLLLLLLLLATSLAFPSFVFMSFPKLTSQIFPPHAVKKSWHFLILALVLFAIAYGFPSTSNHVGDGGSSGSYRRSDTQKSSSCSCDLGREYRFSLGSFGRKKGSGRCPDLRAQDEGRRRLNDRTNLDAGRGFESKPVYSKKKWKGDCDDEEKKFQREPVVANDSCDHNAAVKEMEVAVALPPSALPGAAPKEQKARRTFQTIPYKPKDNVPKPPAALQVPQPPPPPVVHTQLASKKGKTREDLSAPPPAPPPAALHKKKSRTPVTVIPNPESSGDSNNTGGSSPKPPPPPPFKVPRWRFAMSRKAPYVWIMSPKPWRHKSPDAEDYEDSGSETTEGASYSSSEATSRAFCPSPDVNKKAGKFIAAFKAQLNQKKTSSMKQRRSNLGPEIIG